MSSRDILIFSRAARSRSPTDGTWTISSLSSVIRSNPKFSPLVQGGTLAVNRRLDLSADDHLVTARPVGKRFSHVGGRPVEQLLDLRAHPLRIERSYHRLDRPARS